jgi:hypothetical protein
LAAEVDAIKVITVEGHEFRYRQVLERCTLLDSPQRSHDDGVPIVKWYFGLNGRIWIGSVACQSKSAKGSI